MLDQTGSQNQVVADLDKDGRLYIVNVNHGFFGAPHPIEVLVNRTR